MGAHGLAEFGREGIQPFEQFLKRWLAYKKDLVRPRTYHSYQHYLVNHAYEEIGKLRLQQLRSHDVQAMLDSRDMAPRSVKALRDILRNALNDAVRWGECERNPAAHAQPPTQKRQPVAAMTAEQAQALLKQMKGHQLEGLFRLALAVGLRRSEALGLKWEDVDLDNARLQIRRGLHRAPKAGIVIEEPKSETSRRDIALPKMAVDALRAHRKRQTEERLRTGPRWEETGHVFTDSRGRPVDPDVVTHAFKEVARDAKLPTLTLHQLRHGAATLMLAQGVPLRIVQETLGHSSITITADTYAHVAPELQRQAADAIDAALPPAAPGPSRET